MVFETILLGIGKIVFTFIGTSLALEGIERLWIGIKKFISRALDYILTRTDELIYTIAEALNNGSRYIKKVKAYIAGANKVRVYEEDVDYNELPPEVIAKLRSENKAELFKGVHV